MAKKESGTENSAKTVRGRPFQKGHKHAWQPGQSGNPGGRPKTRDLAEAYREQLAKVLANDPEGRTFAQVIAETMILQAARGSVGAAREIADRVLGKPRQALDIDITLLDWRELARINGLDIRDVIAEAKRIIAAEESANASGDAESLSSTIIE